MSEQSNSKRKSCEVCEKFSSDFEKFLKTDSNFKFVNLVCIVKITVENFSDKFDEIEKFGQTCVRL